MECPNCGNTIKEDTLTCDECGHVINKDNQQPKKPSKGSIAIPITGFLFALIALVLFPPVFGGLGIFMGFQTKKHRNDKLGTIVIITSAICLVIGMVLGFLTFSNI